MDGHEFIWDFSVVLVSAGIAAVIFQVLRLPVLFGYLLAGLLVGPHLLPNSPIHDTQAILHLSELGVIFLMFYIGLEFDVRKLQTVLGPALGAILLQTLAMVFIGTMAAPMLGLGKIDGLFLGGLLSISSSMVTIKLLRDRGLFKMPHAQLAVGILILEDILAIMLLVVLTGVAVTGHFEWDAVWQVTFLVGVFVVCVYFIGKLLVTPFTRLLAKIGNIEILSMAVLALALGVGLLAQQFHFSVALGAFLAGSILSQTTLAEEIEHTTEPLRNLFTAIFFVTVGMMIEPQLILNNWKAILIVSALVIIGKVATCWLGLSLAGQSPRSSFRAALAKCQIGEFSFVIASLGQSLNVTGPDLMALAVGVALVTIMMTPILSLKSGETFDCLASRMPSPLIHIGRFYANVFRLVKSRLSNSALIALLKRPLLLVLGYFLFFNGILLLAWLGASRFGAEQVLAQAGVWGFAGLLCVMPLIAIVRNLDAMVMLITETVLSTHATQQFMKGRMRNLFNTVILCVVVFVLGGAYLSTAAAFIPSGAALTMFVLLVVVLAVLLWRHVVKLNSKLEFLFVESFNQQVKTASEAARETARSDITRKYPWPVNVADIELEEGTAACGMRIMDLNLRAETGATIIALVREHYTHFDPSPESPLFPGVHLVLVGTREEIDAARRKLTTRRPQKLEHGSEVFKIESVLVGDESELAENTLAGANVRRRFGVNVLGIQRGEKRITNPRPEEMIHRGDVIMTVGHPEHLERFRQIAEI